jgi:Leucine-rich repeat (LRR) protein
MTSLPGDIFDKLKNINTFSAAYNSITDIPDSLAQAQSLETLDMSNNKINNMDASAIQKCKKMNNLNLSNNDMQNIPPELGLATQLRNINLKGIESFSHNK